MKQDKIIWLIRMPNSFREYLFTNEIEAKKLASKLWQINADVIVEIWHKKKLIETTTADVVWNIK